MKQRERILQRYHDFHYINFAPLRDRQVGFYGFSRKAKSMNWMAIGFAALVITISLVVVL